MDRLQFAVERVGVRRRQGPAYNADQAVEAGRADVQQVSPFNAHVDSLFLAHPRLGTVFDIRKQWAQPMCL